MTQFGSSLAIVAMPVMMSDSESSIATAIAASAGMMVLMLLVFGARILRNDAPKTNHSVRLDLRGDGAKSNRSAIGAVVTVEAGGQSYVRQVTGARGYLSQSELVLTVGIGTATKADKVTIRWPGEKAGTEIWTNLDAGKMHVLEQGKAK